MKNNKMGDCRTKPRNVEWLPNCALGKVKSKVRGVKECLKTWPQQAWTVVDAKKEVPQPTSPSLVSSPHPFDFRLLGFGSPSTNFTFGCLGQH
jgi:hypothetical protein